MPRGSDLVGLPVLAVPSMKRIGRVEEVLVSTPGFRVCGLELDGRGWLRGQRILDFTAVRAIRDTHILTAERYLDASPQHRCCKDLHGVPVLDQTGEELGLMDDFHFDPVDGRVALLQVSRGFVDDLLYGKELVPLSGTLMAGEAAILLGDGLGDLAGGAPGEVSEL